MLLKAYQLTGAEVVALVPGPAEVSPVLVPSAAVVVAADVEASLVALTLETESPSVESDIVGEAVNIASPPPSSAHPVGTRLRTSIRTNRPPPHRDAISVSSHSWATTASSSA